MLYLVSCSLNNKPIKMAKSIQLKNSNNENIYPYSLLKEFVLYSSGGTSGNIILKDSIQKYKYIDIHYIADGIRFSTKVCVDNSGFKFSINTNYTGTNNYHYIYNSTYEVNDKKITFLNARNDFIDLNNNVASFGTKAYINIYKVIGYK